MDIETSKPVTVIKPRLPLAGTNFNFSFSVAVIGKVTLPIVCQLIKDFEHEELLGLIADNCVTSGEALANLVWNSTIKSYDLELSSTIAWIERLVINAESDDSVLGHITVKPGESLQVYFYTLFSTDRHSFNKLVEKLLMKDMKKKNSYTLHNPILPEGHTRKIPITICDSQLESAKALCIPYFIKRGYGPWSGIYSYVTDDCIGFFIERAGYISSRTNINISNSAEETVGRSPCYDLVFYHVSSGAIWLSCQKKDQDHYVSLIQQVVLSEKLSINSRMGIDFAFLSDSDLHIKISTYKSDVIEKLTIHYAHFKPPGEDNTDVICRSGKKGEDCLSKKHKGFNTYRMIPHTMHTMSFAVKVKDQKAKYDIDLTADKIKFSEGLSIEEVLGVVYGFQVIERLVDV